MTFNLPLILLLLCCVGAANSDLRVFNLRARNLRPDKYSRPDGFARVFYESRNLGQTSVRFGNRDPSWTQSFNYYGGRTGGELRVRVYDKDVVFDDTLGTCSVRIQKGNNRSIRCNLSKGGTLYFSYSFS